MSADGRTGPGDDRGAQPERTALSWERTGAAALLLSVAAVRTALLADQVVAAVLSVVGLAAASAAVAAAAATELAYRRMDRAAVHGSMVAGPWPGRLLVTALAANSAAAVAIGVSGSLVAGP